MKNSSGQSDMSGSFSFDGFKVRSQPVALEEVVGRK